MDKWEYCEVANEGGRVTMRQLTEEGNGWIEAEVAKSGVHNMATVLGRLGRQGWEVVTCTAAVLAPRTSYTSGRVWTTAFLKRRIEEL